MRRLEHAVIAFLLAALVALSYVHFRAPRPAVNAPPAAEPVAERPAPPPPAAPGTAPSPEPEPAREESAAERQAREYQELRWNLDRAEEGGQLEALFDLAKKVVRDDGVGGLFWAPCPAQAGSGNDEDLRRLVGEFGKETDPARLWALAQRIRFHLTDPRSRIWTIDAEAYAAFEKWARDAEDPYKRGFALGSAGATGWGDEAALNRDRLLNDPDVRVRATAAGLLPAPKGVGEAEARPVADRFRELLGSTDPGIRASAARGFGAWAYRSEDVEALVRAAREDSSESVRLSATRSLGANGSDLARRTLREIAENPSESQAVRDAAGEQLLDGVHVLVPGGK